jgi:hypothetical protein
MAAWTRLARFRTPFAVRRVRTGEFWYTHLIPSAGFLAADQHEPSAPHLNVDIRANAKGGCTFHPWPRL